MDLVRGWRGKRSSAMRSCTILQTAKSNYRVEEKIGAGSFGVVYRAERIPDGEPVALKFVSIQAQADDARLRRDRCLTPDRFLTSERSTECSRN